MGRRKSKEKIMIVDRGNLELAFPEDWIPKPDPSGHMAISDPTDSCKIEISYLPLPPVPAGDLPKLEYLLRKVLAENKDAKRDLTIVSDDRGDLWFAWTDYTYECDDTDRHERRLAHARLLLASNGKYQALLTFNYWHDDATWATRAWDRMFATMRLGDGTRLKSPWDHWSMKDRPPG